MRSTDHCVEYLVSIMRLVRMLIEHSGLEISAYVDVVRISTVVEVEDVSYVCYRSSEIEQSPCKR